MNRAPGAVGAATLVALLALTGCGSDSDSAPSDAPSSGTSSAAATTPDATESSTGASGDEGPSTEPSAELGGTEIDAAEFIDVYSRALDNATTATISMTVDGPTPSAVDGQIDFTAEPPDVRMTFSSADSEQEQELILVDGQIYFRAPDGTYYSAPASSSPLGAGGGALDPRALLTTLADGIVSASSYGEEDVDGETFGHYGAVLDAAALQEASGAQVPGAGVDTFGFDVYVDGDGLLRRVTIGLGDQGTVDVRYDDWGQPVDISAPPADQVQTAPGQKPS